MTSTTPTTTPTTSYEWRIINEIVDILTNADADAYS